MARLWVLGLTERKLVRRKKNPKIRPELTLIAFLNSSHSDSFNEFGRQLETLEMVIRHSDTFLGIFTSIYSLSSSKQKSDASFNNIGQHNFENKKSIAGKEYILMKEVHTHLIHNLQRNIYMTRNDRDNDKNTSEKSLC